MPTMRLPPSLPPCIFPVAAGFGAGVTSLMMADWRAITGQATAAIGLAGLVGGSVVGGVVYAITKFDQVKIDRQKKYDDANKDSLSAQIERLTAQSIAAAAENIANQQRMRETLHQINNEAQTAQAENANLRNDLAVLRGQFLEISKELRSTDVALHKAYEEMRATRVQLQQATEALEVSERDRKILRAELDVLRLAQHGQGERLAKLEQVGSGSSDSISTVRLPPDALLPPPTPTGNPP